MLIKLSVSAAQAISDAAPRGKFFYVNGATYDGEYMGGAVIINSAPQSASPNPTSAAKGKAPPPAAPTDEEPTPRVRHGKGERL